MDGVTLQDRIYSGYAKAALRLGVEYEQYRFTSPLAPISAANNIGTLNCAFANNEQFSTLTKYKIPARLLYADGRELLDRDILVGPYGTFFIGDMQPNLGIQAVRCNELVSIHRNAYVGIVVTPTPVASGMPAFRMLKKVDQKPPLFGAHASAVAVSEWFMFMPVASGLLEQNDVVIDKHGQPFSIDSIDETEIGIVATMRQTNTNIP